MIIRKNRASIPLTNLRSTGSKIDAIELGYTIQESRVVNDSNVNIKEIMNFIEVNFIIDLGDYYRTYIAIKGRKKDRTPFLNNLIENLIKKIDRDDLA